MKRICLIVLGLTVFSVLPALAQNTTPFGLNADDFQLLQAAIQQTGGAASYHVTVSSALNISGGNVSEIINQTGSGDVIPGETPALAVTMNGTSSNIFGFPANFTRDVTLANSTFYSRLTDSTASGAGEWKNEPAGDMFHSLSRTALLFFDPSAMETMGLPEFLTFFDALSTTDLTPYVTMQRQPDASGQSHFIATLDFQKLFTAPDFVQKLAKQLAESGTQLADNQLSAAGLIVGMVFKGAALATDLYIDADNHIQKITAGLNLPVDAALINGTDTPSISVTLNIEFDLSNFNQPVSVTTLDGIVVNSPSQPLVSNPQTVVNNPGQPPMKTLFTTEPLHLQLSGPFDLAYTITAPETISLYVHSLPTNATPLDTTLEILDPSGKQIAFNDDLTGDTRDAGVENLLLPAPGTYIVRLNTFDLLQGGGVSVEVVSSTKPTDHTGGGAALLDSTGKLDGVHPSSFTFNGQAGQVVTITVRAVKPPSSDLDLSLTLYGPDGKELTSDDDTGGSNGLGENDPALMHYQLPEAGAYRIEVTSWFDTPGDIAVKVEPG